MYSITTGVLASNNSQSIQTFCVLYYWSRRAACVELAAARSEVARLVAITKEPQPHRFGHGAKRLDTDQLALTIEDLE
jgi:pyrimidine deaminase RibD-like protein